MKKTQITINITMATNFQGEVIGKMMQAVLIAMQRYITGAHKNNAFTYKSQDK